MPWKVGGNFEDVAICYATSWRNCVKAVANYFWSEVVSDVVDYVAKEGLIWVLVAISFLILLYIKYRKTTYSKNTVLDNQMLNNMIHTLQDLELKFNVLTYKMQYGILPLPHEIYNLNSKKLKKIRMTLSSPCDRKIWIKHMLLSESTGGSSSSREIKEKMFCDEQTSINKEEITKKRKSRENKDGYFRNNMNVSTARNMSDIGEISTDFIPIRPAIRTEHNVQSSRQILYEVKKKLHSLHNILRMYQHMNQSSERLESINQVDEIDTFVFIKPDIKKGADESKLVIGRDVSSKSVNLQKTRSSKMTDNWEYCELDSSRGSLSSSIGYSSSASTKILRRSAFDLPALVKQAYKRHSSDAILQEDCKNKRTNGETALACARNISNRSRSNDSTAISLKADKDAKGKMHLNAQPNTLKRQIPEAKQVKRYILSAESFRDKSAKTETRLTRGYNIARFEDALDKNVLSQSGGLNDEVLDSSDKEEKSMTFLLQEALQFKKALLAQIRSSIKTRALIEDPLSRRNTTSESSITNVGNRNRILETPSEYFSITDTAIRKNDTKPENKASSSLLPPPVYENVITIRIPAVDVKSFDDETPLRAVGTILKNSQNRVKPRENSERKADDSENLVKEVPSVPKLQDLILTHVKNIRDYMDKFLQSQNKTISTARGALQRRGEENILYRSSEASHTSDQLNINPVVSLPNISPSLLTNTCCKSELSTEDDTFKSCSDVRLKGNPNVTFTFITPTESTFNKENNTQWLRTAEIEQKETDLLLPVMLRYCGESDSKSTREIKYVTSKQNDKTHKQIIASANMDLQRQINKNEGIEKSTQTNDGSNLISRNKSYIIDKKLTSCESMSNTERSVKYSSEEQASVLIFDKSEKEVFEKKPVILNSAASPLRLLLAIKRLMLNADSLLNDLTQNNEVSANINRLQLKAKSDTFLITSKAKDLNFPLKKSHSFSVRNDALEHIRKLLRQSYIKLHNSKIKHIENTSQSIARSTFIISPRETFIKSSMSMSKNHLEAPARRKKHQTHAQSPTVNPMSILWREKFDTKNDINKYSCAEKTALNLSESNVGKKNSVEQLEKYTNTSSKITSEILLNDRNAQFWATDREHSNETYNSDTRMMEHAESVAPEEVIVISIIENGNLQKRNLIYKNGLWSEESFEEKEVIAKPSIVDTCTSISDLH